MLYTDFIIKPGKGFIVLIVLILYNTAMHAQPGQTRYRPLENQLENYTWQKRVLLIVSPSAADEKCIQQKAIAEAKLGEMQERDLEIITLFADNISEADKIYLDNKFNINYSQFNVVLIGKDGGSKLAANEPIAAHKLFEIIDAMPMRREEMKKIKKQD